MPISSLGYVRLAVRDVPRWHDFLTEFIGMAEGSVKGSDGRDYRIDEYSTRLTLLEAGDGVETTVGFEVFDARDLAGFVERVKAAGREVTEGDKAQSAKRGVTGFAHFTDPGGNHVELFYGPIINHRVLTLPLVPSGFVTADQGLGHIILETQDTDECQAFYTEVLGFAERNTLELDSGIVYFLGCNARQHTLGLSPGAGPRLMHLMVETSTLDDTGRALDRAAELDVPMMQSLGRHTNDRMVSFYVWSPEGHAVEIGWGADRIDEPLPTYRITDGAVWGHRFTPPPS